MEPRQRCRESLEIIYGDSRVETAMSLLEELIITYCPIIAESSWRERRTEYFNQSDVVLITYGNSLERDDIPPLRALQQFLEETASGLFSAVHILPFFPYSSDDGFSVCDFFSVNPELGDWEHVVDIAGHADLMADLVINHVSAGSGWMKSYLAGEPRFANLAIEVDPSTDLSMVTRPRISPLLTEFRKDNGSVVNLWTTFSADQVDLNFEDPSVLVKMVEVLLFYVAKGARMIRLDAVAYLWKEIGTNCIHQPETHEVVKLLRAVLDRVAHDVIIITETNVPHGENVSYFGDGYDEAQMVYNFTLPPLLLHSFIKHDTRVMENWARRYLNVRSPECTFFNFTASHDGIGMRPAEGILSPADIAGLVSHTRAMGGAVSSRRKPDGSESPYELNVTYVDAMREPDGPQGNADHARRFMASQEIQLSLPGVPGVYIHSLLGSRNWNEGVELSGQPRRINRQVLDLDSVLSDLDNPGSFRSMVFRQYKHLIEVRRLQPAMHPNASLEVIHPEEPYFLALKRSGGGQTIHVLSNACPEPLVISLEKLGFPADQEDILGGQRVIGGNVHLGPHRTSWLVEK